MPTRKALVPAVLGWLAIVACSHAADPQPKVDLHGDPLPPGAISRLGTVRFRQHGELKGVTYSADGRTLIAFTTESLFTWDAESGRLESSNPIETHSVTHVAFSADRRRAATAGFVRAPADTIYSIQMWDLATSRPLETIYWTDERSPACVSLSANGTLIGAGDHRGTVRIYEAESQEEILSFQIGEHRIRSLAFSPTDERLVIALESERPFLWNWPDGEAPEPLDEAEGWPRSAVWSPDGARFAVARDREDGVHLYDARSRQRTGILADEPGFRYVHAIAFSPDGLLLATADSGTRGITLWDIASGEKTPTHRNRAIGRFLTFSPDGQSLTNSGGSYHTRLEIWNVETGESLHANHGHETIPSTVEFLPGDEKVATAGDDGTLRFWEVATGRQLQMVAHRQGDTDGEDATLWIRAMDISPDGKLAATSGQDDTLRIWDVTKAEEIYRLPGHGRLGGHRMVRFSPDGGRLVSTGDDLFLRTFDVRTGKALAEHPLRPGDITIEENEDGSLKSSDPFGMGPMLGPGAFTSDARQLMLRIESGNSYYLFDVESGKELAKISGGRAYMRAMSLSPDGRRMLIADRGRRKQIQLQGGGMRSQPAGKFTVQIISVPEGKQVREWTLDGRIGGPVTFGPDGRIFAVATWETGKPVRVFATATGRQLAEIDGFDGYPSAIAFSNNGQLLATSLTSGSVLIWDWNQFTK